MKLLGYADPGKGEKTFSYIEIVAKYDHNAGKLVFRQFRRAQTTNYHLQSEPIFCNILKETVLRLFRF